jgi:hypothetical protein
LFASFYFVTGEFMPFWLEGRKYRRADIPGGRKCPNVMGYEVGL